MKKRREKETALRVVRVWKVKSAEEKIRDLPQCPKIWDGVLEDRPQAKVEAQDPHAEAEEVTQEVEAAEECLLLRTSKMKCSRKSMWTASRVA